MLRFKKVVQREKDQTKNKDQKDQKRYNQKVEALEQACNNFGEYLKTVTAETEISSVIKAFGDEKTGFGKQMNKPGMLSRTSKLLHRMKNELSKLKSKNKKFGTIDNKKIEQYKKVFEFKQEKPDKNDYIKRSAIDDKKVAEFFNGNNQNSILGILTNMKDAAEEEIKQLEQAAKDIFNLAKESLNASTQIMNEVNDVQKGIKQTIDNLQAFEKMKSEAKKQNLNELKKSDLENDIATLKKMLEDLKKQLENAMAIVRGSNSTNEQKRQAVDDVKTSTNKNNEKITELKNKIETAKDVNDKVQRQIEEAKANPFDSETGTFTIKTKDDFGKIKKCQSGITKVVVGEKITSIENSAFDSCSVLSSVDLNNIIAIKSGAFLDLSCLKEINLENVKKIGKYAFSGCKNLIGVENVGINLNKVTLVDDETFKDCESITKVILGENCKEIRYSAFSGCTNLREINLENVQVIEDQAFAGCTHLAGLNLKSVTDIHENAFQGSNIKAISKNNITFPTNKDAEDVVRREILGDNVEPKDDGVVEGDTVTVSSAINQIVADAFHGDNKVSKINVRNVQKLTKKLRPYEENFVRSRLKEVNLDDKCRAIDGSVFIFCEALESINLEKVQRIDVSAFEETALETVDLSSALEIKSSAFYGCAALKSVTLGANCQKINRHTFTGCKVLSSINLGSVKKIGKEAFEDCKALETIDLSKVTEIGENAFKGCTGLATVTLPKNEKAADIKRIICEQTGKKSGGGEINFINDPDPAK